MRTPMYAMRLPSAATANGTLAGAGMSNVTPGGKLRESRVTTRGGDGCGHRSHTSPAPASTAVVKAAAGSQRRHRRRRGERTTGSGACGIPVRPSRTHCSSLFRSRAVCHRSSRSLTRHLRTMRSRLAGTSGCSSAVGRTSRSSTAAICAAGDSASNARLPVSISCSTAPKANRIRPRVRVLAPELFGSHVGQRPEDHACARQCSMARLHGRPLTGQF